MRVIPLRWVSKNLKFTHLTKKALIYKLVAIDFLTILIQKRHAELNTIRQKLKRKKDDCSRLRRDISDQKAQIERQER